MASATETAAALAIWLALSITGLLILFRTNIKWWAQQARKSPACITSTITSTLAPAVDLHSLDPLGASAHHLHRLDFLLHLEESAQYLQQSVLSAGNVVQELKTFEKQRLSAEVFTSHKRTEANFVRGNADAKAGMPPKYPPEKALHPRSETALYYVLLTTPRVRGALLDSVGVALLGAGWSAIVWLLDISGEMTTTVLDILAEQVNNLSSSFQFFPSFLLLNLLGYMAVRWRDTLVNCHTVQARLHDIGTSVGGAVLTPDDPNTRRLLYRLYRYLNAVHGLTYQSVHPKLKGMALDPGFVQLGLLTSQEVALLAPMQNKVRDTLIAWVSSVLEELVRVGAVRELALGNMMICGLRGICARHHDLFVRNMPNLWFAVCRLLTDYQVLLKVLDLAFEVRPGNIQQHRDVELALMCATTFIAAFFATVAYFAAFAMASQLDNAFDAAGDSYNTDALLGSTERQLFATLRCRFDRPPESSEEEGIRADTEDVAQTSSQYM